jgi:hypothetical protein
VQVVVFFFVQDVKPIFSFPAVLVVALLLGSGLVLIYSRECKRQVVFGVGVEVVVVLGYCLSQLLLLKLPDVQFLARVREHIHTAR